jgi:hypothetical protein
MVVHCGVCAATGRDNSKFIRSFEPQDQAKQPVRCLSAKSFKFCKKYFPKPSAAPSVNRTTARQTSSLLPLLTSSRADRPPQFREIYHVVFFI